MEWATKKEIEAAFAAAEEQAKPILTNDIKSGAFIKERDIDWCGIIIDNKKGNIRTAVIHGLATEAGSIYVWDIGKVVQDGKLYYLNYTDKQLKDRDRIRQLSF